MAKNPLLLVPNIITIARILAIIPIVYLVMQGDIILRLVALILYVIAAASDWLDGYLARAWNQYSPFGRMLDPIADKLLVGALLLVFCFDGSFGGWDLIPATIMVDASHANSSKNPENQPLVLADIGAQMAAGDRRIIGVMVESNLVAGRQDLVEGRELVYGQSITDGCIDWDTTVTALEALAEAVTQRRAVTNQAVA